MVADKLLTSMRARAAAQGGVREGDRVPAWPMALAVAMRVGAWLLIPGARFASDEDSYYLTGIAFLRSGTQDLFWPPVTGWLIAAGGWLLHTTDVRVIRLLWVAMDIGCLFAVRTLTRRVAAALPAIDGWRPARLVTLTTLAYGLYLPALSFSQFATSEIPALLQLLVVLVLLTCPQPSGATFAAAGVLMGTLVLTRTSLLPLLLFLPLATLLHHRSRPRLRHAAIFVTAGSLVIGVALARNWMLVGEVTLARNSAYNLFIGNQDVYAEDLDLFHPVATPEQIEFRRQYFSGTLAYPTDSPEELQRRALAWMRAHPGTVARRAVGRLARVFAPKTDVLELVGGERAVGVFSPRALAVLAIANAQWAFVLFAGLVGLAASWRAAPTFGALLALALAGCLPLCLIAIAKPRYAFTFEPLLLIGAVVFAAAPRDTLRQLSGGQRWGLALVSAFLLWGWVAWFIFAVSSRLALSPS
jgi:hypothetical protein